MNLTTSQIDATRVRDFAADLTIGLGKVAAKFVEDAILGIRQASSVNLTDVAKALHEPSAIHATQKRLSRNLARPEVHAVVSARLLKLAARRVHKDTPLFVHVRSLTKQYARKMQYLLPEEAELQVESAGYRICEVIASEPDSTRFVPVAAHLWSPNAPDYQSDSEEILCTLRRVVAATNGRGIFHLHHSVREHGLSGEQLTGVARLQGIYTVPDGARLGWLYQGKPHSLAELTDACDRPFGVTLYKMHSNGTEDVILVDVGAIDVSPVGAQTAKQTLIVEGWDSPRDRSKEQRVRACLSTLPLRPTRKCLTNIVAADSAVAQVVQSDMQHKDAYQLGRFRVLTFDRMQTLLTLLQAVTFYDAAIARCARIEEMSATLRPRPGDHKRTFMVPESVLVQQTYD